MTDEVGDAFGGIFPATGLQEPAIVTLQAVVEGELGHIDAQDVFVFEFIFHGVLVFLFGVVLGSRPITQPCKYRLQRPQIRFGVSGGRGHAVQSPDGV
jgi:hypothetical protein